MVGCCCLKCCFPKKFLRFACADYPAVVTGVGVEPDRDKAVTASSNCQKGQSYAGRSQHEERPLC
jgi:hypothetical protein